MPIGVIVNGLSVVFGGMIGGILGNKLSDRFKAEITLVFGVCSMGMGINSIPLMENMPAVINAQQALFDIEKEEALADEQAFNSKIGLGSIGSVEEFEANKDKIITKIQEETEWTKA